MVTGSAIQQTNTTEQIASCGSGGCIGVLGADAVTFPAAVQRIAQQPMLRLSMFDFADAQNVERSVVRK